MGKSKCSGQGQQTRRTNFPKEEGDETFPNLRSSSILYENGGGGTRNASQQQQCLLVLLADFDACLVEKTKKIMIGNDNDDER